MRQEKSDISLLLVILVLFSASIGLLHGFKISLVSAASDTQSISLSEQDMFDLVFPQVLSDNMDKAAAILQQFDGADQLKVVQQIIRGEGVALSDEQKIKLLIAMASYADTLAKKNELFSLLLKHFTKSPVFAIAVNQAPGVVEPLIEWAKNKKTALNPWKYASVAQALGRNDVALLTDLYTHGLRLTPQEAGMVLDRVVSGQRDVKFIPLLARQFKADLHYSADGRQTPLIKAVEMKQPDMVRALIAVGADPQYSADSSFGSAQALAEKIADPIIISILREY